MNETIRLILDRRSVRKFLPTPIEEAMIEAIVSAGTYAPSARNRQNWHFTVVTNKAMIEDMHRLMQKGMESRGIKVDPAEHVFYHAPLVIVVSSLLEGFSEMNAGCAIQNMAIAAKSLWLDSCVIGQTRFMYTQTNKVDIHRMLKVPMDYEHDCSICIGYRDGDNPAPKPRRDGVVDYLR